MDSITFHTLAALWLTMPQTVHVLAGLFLLLQVADIVSTCLALRRGGAEANPIARWAISRYPAQPAVGLTALKVLTVIPLFALPLWGAEAARITLTLAVWVYIWVIYNNVRVLRGLELGS
jgi:hypothetical protein